MTERLCPPLICTHSAEWLQEADTSTLATGIFSAWPDLPADVWCTLPTFRRAVYSYKTGYEHSQEFDDAMLVYLIENAETYGLEVVRQFIQPTEGIRNVSKLALERASNAAASYARASTGLGLKDGWSYSHELAHAWAFERRVASALLPEFMGLTIYGALTALAHERRLSPETVSEKWQTFEEAQRAAASTVDFMRVIDEFFAEAITYCHVAPQLRAASLGKVQSYLESVGCLDTWNLVLRHCEQRTHEGARSNEDYLFLVMEGVALGHFHFDLPIPFLVEACAGMVDQLLQRKRDADLDDVGSWYASLTPDEGFRDLIRRVHISRLDRLVNDPPIGVYLRAVGTEIEVEMLTSGVVDVDVPVTDFDAIETSAFLESVRQQIAAQARLGCPFAGKQREPIMVTMPWGEQIEKGYAFRCSLNNACCGRQQQLKTLWRRLPSKWRANMTFQPCS